MTDLNLKKRCHVNTNDDGDRFVGVKANTEGERVYFPMGYRLSDNDADIREDILNLIDILSVFNNSKDSELKMDKFEAPQTVNFPVNAYMNIIRDYLEKGHYYNETECIRKKSDRGKIDFPATLRRNVSFIQDDGTPIFDGYTVKGTAPNERNLITKIHKFCVYKSFLTLGWLFTPNIPEDPHVQLEKDKFLFNLRKKLGQTNNDKDKLLFQSMIYMIEYLDDDKNRQYYFGTENFEYVWERLIDRVFGIIDKEEYFPRSRWNLKFSNNKDNHALEPDTIMICDNKVYVVDAKYYRYGVTGVRNHLPESSSINKQITYAEYIETSNELKSKYGNRPIYNAFLMPFNRTNNPFSVSQYYLNIGEGISDWKHNDKTYEKVQGIVIDITFLMKTYSGSHSTQIKMLAKEIEKSLENDDEKA